jgi:hypothetical protein
MYSLQSLIKMYSEDWNILIRGSGIHSKGQHAFPCLKGQRLNYSHSMLHYEWK